MELSSEYVFQQPAKLNFIATKDNFLVFKDGDVLSGLTLKTPSITVAITSMSGKEIAVINLGIAQQSSLIVLKARVLYISPSNDSAVVTAECYTSDDIKVIEKV